MGVLTGISLPPAEVKRPAAADFVRVVASFSVAWYHIWQQSWVGAGPLDFWVRSGFLGVDALVLLSAFCLYLPYAGAEPGDGALHAAAFYRRRAARILPPYYVNLLAALLIALAGGHGGRALWADLAAHLSLTQQFFPVSYLGTALNGVTWTLTVFAAFYLLFPLLVWGVQRWPAVVYLLLFGVQGTYTAWVLTQYGNERYSALFNQFPAFCGVLAVGLLAAKALVVLARQPCLQAPAARLLCTLGGLAALWGIVRCVQVQSAAAEPQRWQLVGRMAMAGLVGAGMVLLTLGLPAPEGGRRVLRRLAGISYNLYLWHQMLCVWLKYDVRMPFWQGDTPPNQLGDTGWMRRANGLYWGVALAAAVLFTGLTERLPAYLRRKNSKKEAKEERKKQKTRIK